MYDNIKMYGRNDAVVNCGVFSQIRAVELQDRLDELCSKLELCDDVRKREQLSSQIGSLMFEIKSLNNCALVG